MQTCLCFSLAGTFLLCRCVPLSNGFFAKINITARRTTFNKCFNQINEWSKIFAIRGSNFLKNTSCFFPILLTQIWTNKIKLCMLAQIFILHYSLFTMHYSLFTIHYSLFTIHYSLFIIHYSLFTMHYSLFTIHYSLFTMHYSLFIIHYSLVLGLLPPIRDIFCLQMCSPNVRLNIMLNFALLMLHLEYCIFCQKCI